MSALVLPTTHQSTVHQHARQSDYSETMDRFTTCITPIRDWMTSNRLKLNEDKTQVI